MEKITEHLTQATPLRKNDIIVWEEHLELPTYEPGKPDKNPLFLERRVYQGSSGAVYPYPVIESISDVKTYKSWRVIFMENEYLKIMIMPELGGRIQMAFDKVRKRHFAYHNQVIKPALVGLAGPWISGGIEINWPQHHRPSTFLPLDCVVEEDADDMQGVTVWCGEIERISRLKGMHGYTMYPGRAFLEIRGRVYNRTAFPQTFLWWANPAVSVNEHYHSVFPPDVTAVYDHGRRDVSSFPIAKGVYYKHDYSAGVDISRYANIPVPTSFMAVSSKYDFIGGYREDEGAGLLHVAEHRIAPGKKQWTWGNSDFGRAWDRNLTDEDGPYVELMTGVYTDNQPDFTWIRPGEEKSFRQYFMPYAGLGYVKNASRDAVVSLEALNGRAEIAVYVTSAYSNLCIELKTERGDALFSATLSLDPSKPYSAVVPLAGDIAETDLILSVFDECGHELISYRPDPPSEEPVPKPASPILPPDRISTVEELYFAGLHLEQYRHATLDPGDYYREALRRQPLDARCNNALGLLEMRRGLFSEAEQLFRASIAAIEKHNGNPADGDAYYNLGVCLRYQGKLAPAYDAFYKATWNCACPDSAWLALAQLDASRNNPDWNEVIKKAREALQRNANNHKASHLLVSAMFITENNFDACTLAHQSLALDPLNAGCRYELDVAAEKERNLYYKSDKVEIAESQLMFRPGILSGNITQTALEYAFDYIEAGMIDAAILLLLRVSIKWNRKDPMLEYLLAYLYSKDGDNEDALYQCEQASEADPSYCFPSRIEEMIALQHIIGIAPNDARAHYYLGNFMYSARRYDEAIELWQRSSELDPGFATVWRNLAIAVYNKRGDGETARGYMEKSFGLDRYDARVLMELDQLSKRLGDAPSVRLARLEQRLDLVSNRDDLSLERATLYNDLGRYAQACSLLLSRRYHPWEGGEGKVTAQYVRSRTGIARHAIQDGDYERALALLSETDIFPDNLGEGKLPTLGYPEVDYYRGSAYRGLGNEAAAIESFTRAAAVQATPSSSLFYNDSKPEDVYYRGLALNSLGRRDEASACFRSLVDYGEEQITASGLPDFFAVSFPDISVWQDDPALLNRLRCEEMIELGRRGLELV
jgi:tetratricopeptide (TPR) repeat protein